MNEVFCIERNYREDLKNGRNNNFRKWYGFNKNNKNKFRRNKKWNYGKNNFNKKKYNEFEEEDKQIIINENENKKN